MVQKQRQQPNCSAWHLLAQVVAAPIKPLLRCFVHGRYVVSDLGPRFVAEMRRMIKNKTYSQVGKLQQLPAGRCSCTADTHLAPDNPSSGQLMCCCAVHAGFTPAGCAKHLHVLLASPGMTVVPASCALVHQAKPKALTDEQWMDQINDTLIKVAGLDEHMDAGDSGDEGEVVGNREVGEAAASSLQ